MNDEHTDEAALECVACEIITRAHLRQRNYRSSGAPYEIAFLRRDGEWFVLPIESFTRVRAILAELALQVEAIDVLCGIGEDRETLHAQATGRAPLYLH